MDGTYTAFTHMVAITSTTKPMIGQTAQPRQLRAFPPMLVSMTGPAKGDPQ